MKYVKAEVETIVLENVDIITASPSSDSDYVCRFNGSDDCFYYGYVCTRLFKYCLLPGGCTLRTGLNSYEDPTDTI